MGKPDDIILEHSLIPIKATTYVIGPYIMTTEGGGENIRKNISVYTRYLRRSISKFIYISIIITYKNTMIIVYIYHESCTANIIDNINFLLE